MSNILIIGATRGLGVSLANAYATQPDTTVYGTTRSTSGPQGLNEKIVWVTDIDVSEGDIGKKLLNQLGKLEADGGGEVRRFDTVVSLISACGDRRGHGDL